MSHLVSGPAYLRIGVDSARSLLARGGVLLLDVRDPQSFAAEHIDSAVHVTGATLDRFILQTPKDTPVLIYCYHGNASRSYAQIFIDFGFREVYSLDEGYEGWRTAQAMSETRQSTAGLS
jgi:rhodanese-related sulfurtransferase